MDPITRAGAASDEFAADAPGGVKYPWNKIALGDDGVDDGTVSDTNPLPVKVDALPLPAGAATQASLAVLPLWLHQRRDTSNPLHPQHIPERRVK